MNGRAKLKPIIKRQYFDDTPERTLKEETDASTHYNKDNDDYEIRQPRHFKNSKSYNLNNFISRDKVGHSRSFLSDESSQLPPLSVHNSMMMNRMSAEKPFVADVQKINRKRKELLIALENYKPKSSFLDLQRLKTSLKTRIKHYKNAIYYGETNNDQRHGTGVLIYSMNEFYEGDWENDLKHGQGYQKNPNGSTYEGQFINGKYDGSGVYRYSNGEVYQGQFQDGLKHGFGSWKGRNGEYYNGEWKFGKQDGKGVFMWKNGDRYEGDFREFLKHGKGFENFSNGDYYVGNYRNGKPHGYGEYYWADKSSYKGYFKNGFRYGRGIWCSGEYGNVDEYDGEWVNDKKSGYGVFRWASGNHYEGDFNEDERHGYGIMHWVNKSYYKGLWRHGMMDGEGEIFIPGQGRRIGLFKNNKFMNMGPRNGEEYEPESMLASQINSRKTTAHQWYDNIQEEDEPPETVDYYNQDDDDGIKEYLPEVNPDKLLEQKRTFQNLDSPLKDYQTRHRELYTKPSINDVTHLYKGMDGE